jgi:hypothetical protein
VQCRLAYNKHMARGWESKAIEEQLGAREAEKEARAKPQLTADELAERARIEGLQLSRARIVRELEAARNQRYRALLERTLAHLDAELARFETSDASS